MNTAAKCRTAMEMVQEARSRIESLTPAQVEEEMRKGAMLVDLRETEERMQHGNIPGALHFPRGMLEFWADPSSPYHKPEFSTDKRIILHCMKGARSALAADTLQQLGFKNAAHMEGGYERWRDEGHPVTSTQQHAL